MGLSRGLKIIRRKLEPRLIYSPFLRLILFNGWFQLSFGAFALAILAGALYLPKIWLVSPPDFSPEVRISWLDMTQNWALKRSAGKLMAEGDYALAAKSWEAAVAQNPADTSALHGFLTNSLKVVNPDKRLLISAASQMPWLLRLSGTNTADVDLVAAVCHHFGWHEALLQLLAPVADRLSPASDTAYLKALFHQGRIAEFRNRIQKAAPETLLDSELPIYRLALKAGWTMGAEGASARKELTREASGSQHGMLATRLQMLVSAQTGDPETYTHCLDRLSARNEATLADNTRLWELLVATGRRAEAKSRAEAFTSAPQSPNEVVLLAQAYHFLGLPAQTREVLQHFAPLYHSYPGIWVLYASLLEEERDWPALRTIALRMREDTATRGTLWGFSYLLEGCAELEEGRKATADISFTRAADSTFEIPSIALRVGKELTRREHPKLALQVLTPLATAFQNEYAYWDAVFDAGFAAMDHVAVLKGAEHCYRLKPDDISNSNRYAAALILNRSNSEEAIKITLQLYAKFPGSTTAIINHSCALLLNHRASEARKLLEQINPSALGSMEAQAYYLALFEAYHDLKLWDLAEKLEPRISVSSLFPIQKQWLELQRKDIPAHRSQDSEA